MNTDFSTESAPRAPLDYTHDDEVEKDDWQKDYEASLASDTAWLSTVRGRMVVNARSGVVAVIARSGIVRRRIRAKGKRTKGKMPVARAVLTRADGRELLVNIDQLRAHWVLLPEAPTQEKAS